MPKGGRKGGPMKRHALTFMEAKKFGPGKYADGEGLWLFKSSAEAGKWIVRLVVSGKRREMGLGRWPDVSIAEARERAADARKQLRDGLDPIEERAKQKYKPKRLTVAEAIEDCFRARQAELKNDGQAGRWMSPLRVHVIPKIGPTPVEDVDQHILRSVFEPIWHEKPDVARKAMNRMNLTLKHAAALGLDVDLQATMKMRALLGKRRHEVQHIPSLPYNEAPAFYRMLCEKEFVTALALRFLMLTVARTSEVRFATFDEIDNNIWHLPPERTKTGRDHRIPLTDEAIKVLELAKNDRPDRLIFPSPTERPLSDAAMAAFMKREGFTARPHGLRATFRTWAENETDADWETKEAALGHTIGNQVERAYQRSDLLAKRHQLLDEWANFLSSESAS
jgi:integrase